MPKGYNHLTYDKRCQIKVLLERGFSQQEIAEDFGVHQSTISRETARNSGDKGYRHKQAQEKMEERRRKKSSQLYIRDSGILHTLLSIPTYELLHVNQKLSASWEGFATEQIISRYHMQSEECYFWATQSDAELDLFFIKDGKRLGFEFKYTDHPKVTKSMIISLESLSLDHLYVVFPHNQTFPLTEKITAIGLAITE